MERLGPDASGLEAGQAVAGPYLLRGYSQYIVLPAQELYPVPAGVDPGEAVTLVFNYIAAYQMLHRVAHVADGQRILVHGAAGGLGTAFLEPGHLAGLEMYGTASKPKQGLVQRLSWHCSPGGVDMLAGRDAQPLKDWLAAHPGAEIICRDRSGSYTEGAQTGTPEAQQVADRFHHRQNPGKAVERCIARHRSCLRTPEARTHRTGRCMAGQTTHAAHGRRSGGKPGREARRSPVGITNSCTN